MIKFLLDVVYYVLPGMALVYVYFKLKPRFGSKEPGRFSPLFLIIILMSVAAIFTVNAFIWYTAIFFILRG